MNLRILKKLSKRAAPLLIALGDNREQFRSARGDNYHGAFIGQRKHWERHRCHPTWKGLNSWSTARGADIVFTTRRGHTVAMSPPSHPRKGTMMVGAVSGYYEPEWDEECAWIALENRVRNHFMEWDDTVDDEDEEQICTFLTRDLSTPSLIFAAAREISEKRRR